MDTVCSNRRMIRIAGDDYPAQMVKPRFLKSDSPHIRYVLSSMADSITYIRNIKEDILAALYNAPATIGNYYSAIVNHDMCGIGERR